MNFKVRVNLICLLGAMMAAAMFFANTANTADAQLVRLKAAASVSGDVVRLYDVGYCSGLPKGAGRIVVLLATRGRAYETIDISQVEKALLNVGINPAKVAFSGSAACKVEMADVTAEHKLKAEEIKKAARREKTATQRVEQMHQQVVSEDVNDSSVASYITATVAAQLKCDVSELRIKFNRASVALAKMPVTGDMEITTSDSINGLGRYRWNLQYDKNGRRIRRVITGNICRLHKVVVAKRPLRSDTMLGASDLVIAEIEDDGTSEYYSEISQVTGRQLRRAVGSNDPIELDNIESPVLVHRGSDIWVSCGVVKMAAKAKENGRLGERIRVENPRSGREFQAVVTGAGKVRIGSQVNSLKAGEL